MILGEPSHYERLPHTEKSCFAVRLLWPEDGLWAETLSYWSDTELAGEFLISGLRYSSPSPDVKTYLTNAGFAPDDEYYEIWPGFD